mmetsp:Transcript_106000/g.299685  ORF Transcript_106000/g.299685 Transcript_106000/m.299685 type:complete len:232 (+) Transcript_106000:1007-1702(+)
MQCQVLPVLPGQGRVIHGGSHGNDRRVNRVAHDARNLCIRDERLGPPWRKPGDADGNDVAGHCLLDGIAGHALHNRDVFHLASGNGVSRDAFRDNLLAFLDLAAEDFARDSWTKGRELVHLRHKHGEPPALLVLLDDGRVDLDGLRRRHVVADRLVERQHAAGPGLGFGLLQAPRAEALLPRRVEGRIVQLLIARRHVDKNVEDLVLHLPMVTDRRPIDLVDDNQGLDLGV